MCGDPVLSRDIMTIPEDEILSTDVVYTIVGGKTACQKQTGYRIAMSTWSWKALSVWMASGSAPDEGGNAGNWILIWYSPG